MTPAHPADTPHPEPAGISVGDVDLGKSRLLSQQCGTCVFRPGNPMHLSPGRLRVLVQDARSDAGGYIICHQTLPYGPYPQAKPAICRGFYDRYDTTALRLMAALWGFVEVDPPGDATAAPAAQHDQAGGVGRGRGAV